MISWFAASSWVYTMALPSAWHHGPETRGGGNGRANQRPECYLDFMVLHGRVQAGRIVVQDSVDLPEGAEVRLALLDQDEELDAEDRARLEAALARGRQQIAEGKGIPAEQVVGELWAAHRR
jgi:hypothetical protein